MFKVYIQHAEGQEKMGFFMKPHRADECFIQLMKMRTEGPALLELRDGDHQRKCFRLDEDCADDARWIRNDETVKG